MTTATPVVLQSLSLWFTDGKALVPDERLALDDWLPTPSGKRHT
jgi:hypothetical protein